VNSDIAFGGFYLQCLPAGYNMSSSAELLIGAAMGSQWCASIKQLTICGSGSSGVGLKMTARGGNKKQKGLKVKSSWFLQFCCVNCVRFASALWRDLSGVDLK
jgi:hypothetical protein